MARLVLLVAFLALIGLGYGSLPRNERPPTGDDAALKRFLIRNNRLPYPNETVSEIDQPNVGDWTTCEGCKLLVVELRNILKNPQEITHLKELLSRVCELRVISHYKAECLNMVDNLIVVLHQIEPILDNPTLVCQELQYCPESARNSITPRKRLALLLAYKLLAVMRPGRVNDLPCDECIFAVSELKSLVQSKSIQDELKQELHKICRMAGQYESECSALVDQYFDLMIQELIQLLSNGRQCCVDLGLCHASRTSVPLARLKPAQTRAGRVQLNRFHNTPNIPQLEAFFLTYKRIQTRQGINAGCLVCQAAFKEMFEILSQERTATMITSDLTNFVCSLMPDTLKSGCTDFMKIYSRAFLQLVLSEFTPSQVCSAMGICKPEDERKIEQLSPSEKSEAVCDACQVLSQYLSFEFQQADFQEEVINTLKRGCTIFPGDYAIQVRCETYLQTYMPYIMENIMAPRAQTMCPTLGVCPGQQATPMPMPA